MAWKRGVANNQAGVIRKGHIREFLVPSSRSLGVSMFLTVINTEELESKLAMDYREQPIALFNSSNANFNDSNVLYLHSHEHALCVVTAIRCQQIPEDSIALNEAQRVNCKVCTGEREQWTIFDGNKYKLDNREGVIGDTSLKYARRPLPTLSEVQFDVRMKYSDQRSSAFLSSSKINASTVVQHLQRAYFECIVTLEELLAVTIPGTEQQAQVEVVCRASAMHVDEEGVEIGEEQDEIAEEDVYRGFVDASTRFHVVSTTDILDGGSGTVGSIVSSFAGRKKDLGLG